jgi:hypothetical protein
MLSTVSKNVSCKNIPSCIYSILFYYCESHSWFTRGRSPPNLSLCNDRFLNRCFDRCFYKIWMACPRFIVDPHGSISIIHSKFFITLHHSYPTLHCYKNYSKWSCPLEKCRSGNEKAPCWCRNILPLAHTDILLSSMLEISPGLWSRTFSVLLQENSVRASNYKCQKKLPEIHRMGRGSPGLRIFSKSVTK